MVIKTKYEFGKRVKIKELTSEGRVISVWATSIGLQIEVRYFMDGKAQKEYFFEDELELIEG